MDKSVDSIGSCSLDVDADSTDCSDTSGSSNFKTPSSTKDVTTEFTSKFKQRCELSQNTLQQAITKLDCMSGDIQTTLKQSEINADKISVKNPSYLNLACCVNGYSNLTTYDSQLRQNINKSRKVSSIRPSTNSIKFCKSFRNLLAPNCFKYNNIDLKSKESIMMDNENKVTLEKCKISDTIAADITDYKCNVNAVSNNNENMVNIKQKKETISQCPKSFIQQRVERLYGVEAVTKGFYNPKKPIHIEQESIGNQNDNTLYFPTGELNGNEVKILNNEKKTIRSDNENSDLPVFRHLRPEFRAQLPSVSPKKFREEKQSCNNLEVNNIQQYINTNSISQSNGAKMTKDIENLSQSTNIADIPKNSFKKELKQLKDSKFRSILKDEIINNTDEDGKFFLNLVKKEQVRLLELAALAEAEIDLLSNDPEISEDVFGFLRSASGKARLLVSQKMDQFAGLCLENLNPNSEKKFPTTVADLQGFWDMVKLQIDHIDSIFKEILILKENNWKDSIDTVLAAPSGSKLITCNIPHSNSGAKNETIRMVEKRNNLSLAAEKREMQRKKFIDFKRKNKMAITALTKNLNSKDVSSNEFIS